MRKQTNLLAMRTTLWWLSKLQLAWLQRHNTKLHHHMPLVPVSCFLASRACSVFCSPHVTTLPLALHSLVHFMSKLFSPQIRELSFLLIIICRPPSAQVHDLRSAASSWTCLFDSALISLALGHYCSSTFKEFSCISTPFLSCVVHRQPCKTSISQAKTHCFQHMPSSNARILGADATDDKHTYAWVLILCLLSRVSCCLFTALCLY